MDTVPVTIPHWDAITREWRTLTVNAPAEPRRRTRSRRTRGHRQGSPRDLTGLSDGSPLDPYWCDTAYAEVGPLADMRTYLPAATIQTHRPAVTLPADPGRITVTA
jgi:hypothetical protein